MLIFDPGGVYTGNNKGTVTRTMPLSLESRDAVIISNCTRESYVFINRLNDSRLIFTIGGTLPSNSFLVCMC